MTLVQLEAHQEVLPALGSRNEGAILALFTGTLYSSSPFGSERYAYCLVSHCRSVSFAGLLN